MTVTESRPVAATEAAAQEPLNLTGLAGALGTGDHKSLGRMYMLFGLIGGLLSSVLTLLVNLERTSVDQLDDVLGFGSANQFFQTWSLARTSMLFFCVLPLLIGLATYVVPLQVGAPSIAFPRAAAAAFWTWLVAISIHVVTVFVDGGLGDVRPLQVAQGLDPETTELSLLSIGLVVLAVMLATICIVTTVIGQRPLGMTLLDVPMFSWSMVVAGAVWLLAFPVWIANLVAIWVDFQGADATYLGRVDNMWGELDWLWGQPMIFAFAIPVLGIVVDSVASATGVRQKGYGLIQGAIGAFGALTFGAYVQPFFAPQVRHNGVYVVMALLAALPVLAVLGGVADSLRSGRIRFGAHLGISVFALLALLAGVGAAVFSVAGAAVGVVTEFDDKALAGALRWLDDLDGTVLATGVMQLALGAGLIGAVAGIYHWGPKIFGRKLNTGGGMLAGLALLGGTVLLGGSNIVNGILDERDAVYAPDAYDGVWDTSAVEAINWVGAVGALLLIAGLALVLLDITVSGVLGLGDDENADDPWQGQTLEWATDSPPPLGNFAAAPARILTPQPLLDAKESDQ